MILIKRSLSENYGGTRYVSGFVIATGAVRERAHRLLAIGFEDRLPNFRVYLDSMGSP
jgi:hypothetical protein